MRRRLVSAVFLGLALAGAPAAHAASFKGGFELALTGGHIRGYTVELSGGVGSKGGLHDGLLLTLFKQTGGAFEEHSWSFALAPGEAKVNRRRVSVKVRHSLGPVGKVDFTFIGRPHLQRQLCPGKPRFIVVAPGTMTGSIRIRLGDGFFGTVVVRRMTGVAENLYFCPGSFSVCPARGYAVNGSGPFNTGARSVSFSATLRSGRNPASLEVDVQDPTAGTPFDTIFHTISTFLVTHGLKSAAKHAEKISLRSNPQLSGATLRASGRLLAGEVDFSALTSLGQSQEHCGRRHVATAIQGATITAGRLVARFDSIGDIALDAGLNGTPDNPGFSQIQHTP